MAETPQIKNVPEELHAAIVEHARAQGLTISQYLLRRIAQLAHKASAYDASYIAPAESLGAPLVTAERRLAVGVEGLTSAAIESYAATS